MDNPFQFIFFFVLYISGILIFRNTPKHRNKKAFFGIYLVFFIISSSFLAWLFSGFVSHDLNNYLFFSISLSLASFFAISFCNSCGSIILFYQKPANCDKCAPFASRKILHRWWLEIISACITLLLLANCISILTSIPKLENYQNAMEKIRTHPAAIEALGSPINGTIFFIGPLPDPHWWSERSYLLVIGSKNFGFIQGTGWQYGDMPEWFWWYISLQVDSKDMLIYVAEE